MRIIRTGVVVVVLAGGRAWGAGDIRTVLEATTRANLAAAESQKRVTQMAEETAEMLAQYRATQQEAESLRVYNAQLEKLLTAQKEEIVSLEEQIERARIIAREVTPLMLRMLQALDAFIGLDVPFLQEERRRRVIKLKEMMNRADVSDSEKYRRILEAYQIENDYGRTLEAYQGTSARNGQDITVNFLRIGRVVLLQQTLDGREAQVWDQHSRAWKPLPSSYRAAIDKGLRMARRQLAPDLLALPVPSPRDPL